MPRHQLDLEGGFNPLPSLSRGETLTSRGHELHCVDLLALDGLGFAVPSLARVDDLARA